MDLTNKDFEKLRDFFASREDELVSVLERLCRHPSVRGPEEEGAPFGRECLKCLKDAAAIFEERGFTARLSLIPTLFLRAPDGYTESRFPRPSRMVCL